MERRERYTTAAGSSPSTLEEIVMAARDGTRSTFTLEEMRTVLMAMGASAAGTTGGRE